MRAAISALALLLFGALLQSGAGATTPAAAYRPHAITAADARLLVLDTKPILTDIAHGLPVVIGSSGTQLRATPLRPGMYTVPVSTAEGRSLGIFTVDARTAQVFGVDGKQLKNPELQIAQRVLREAYGISVVAPALLAH